MPQQFAPELESTLHRALAEAQDRKQRHATIEHLLLALTHAPSIIETIAGCGSNIEALRADVTGYLDKELDALKEEAAPDPSPTEKFKATIQRAILYSKSDGREEVTTRAALLALFSERESFAVHFLEKNGLSRLNVLSFQSF